MAKENKLRIGYFADGIWSHNAFNLINDDESFEIAFICPRFDTKDEVLSGFAEKYGIDYIKAKNVNSQEFIEQLRQYDCDIFVSMSFNQIFKDEIINLPKHKIINCHAGKLPFYRGRNILNWVLINDEKEFGITVHYVDSGIDTGDIILQKVYPISDSDNYDSLLKISHFECAKVLYESLLLIKSNELNLVKQSSIHPVGMYCGQRREGDELIDWTLGSRELFNFIRAISKPGPMAKCFLHNKEFFINSAQMIQDAPIYKGVSGQILYKEGDNLIVKTKDSILKITDYYYEGSVKIGDRLKND